jgi:DNA repair protein RecO (recombination protein O)
MVEWSSEAIVIKHQQFSDDKLLCWLLTKDHGVHKGLLSVNKKTKNQIQIGNIVHATWKARLQEHLGSYYCELIKPISMSIIADRKKLSSILSICSILSSALPERVQEPEIYGLAENYFISLKDNIDWLEQYIHLELSILKEMGFGLYLNSCGATGSAQHLHYISPKTGSAISFEAGKAYHDKLFILPNILKLDNAQEASIDDIVEALKILEYFFLKNIYKPHNQEIPEARKNFHLILM